MSSCALEEYGLKITPSNHPLCLSKKTKPKNISVNVTMMIHIGSIERGEGNITIKTLDQLAKILGVHSRDLLKP